MGMTDFLRRKNTETPPSSKDLKITYSAGVVFTGSDKDQEETRSALKQAFPRSGIPASERTPKTASESAAKPQTPEI